MVMVDVWPAAYRQTHISSRFSWSEGWWPLGAAIHSSDEPGESRSDLSRCHHHKHRPGITTTVMMMMIVIIIIIIIIITTSRKMIHTGTAVR